MYWNDWISTPGSPARAGVRRAQAKFERAQGNIFKMGFDPMQLPLKQREEDIISCSTNRQAQLPDYLRERYGLPPGPERHFKELSVRTWWDQRESERLGPLPSRREYRLRESPAAGRPALQLRSPSCGGQRP